MSINEINVLVLAYLGDTIYEDYIRKYLIYKGIAKVNDLQTEASNYVSAKAQAPYLKQLLDDNFFTEEEQSIIRRARNNKSNSHPKNCDIVTYKYATGLESLIGYLSLENNIERIDEIMNFILGE
jgi:ribonuclease-3 family protein